jgi:outer membrane protein OmpA-like peptidoglycan-associated protein
MNRNRFVFLVGVVFVVGLISSTGCLTKKYMHGEIAVLDEKIEGVEDNVEENQKRIKRHDERLSTLGSIITEHESQFSKVDNKFNKVDSKIEEVKRYARGTLILREILRNNDAKFRVDSYELSDAAKKTLDKFIEKLVAQDLGVYIEIQGHTDSTGPEAWNLVLGKRRAEAAMEYLYKTYHIPLHRMEVISFASSEPVADNSTRQGRAQNRRIEILVYE